MRRLEAAIPVRMRRVALVAPADALRDVLVRVADLGAVEIGPAGGGPEGSGDVLGAGGVAGGAGGVAGGAADAAGVTGDAARRLLRASGGVPQPALAPARPDLDSAERADRYDLLAGEAQLESYATAAVGRSGATALAGWVPASRLDAVADVVAEVGGTLVRLPSPPGVQPPTLIAGRPLRRSVSPLVQTYGTVPYADIDPVWLAWASYVLMFGMMFGDVGEGALLVAAAAALRAGWPRWARRFRAAWPFVGGAGLAATVFGLLYGECFGPTGLVPALWLDPLDHPNTLLAAAVGVGAVLLAGAYALGTVNRWREGGWASMLYAPSGAAGSGLFLGVGAVAGGWYFHNGGLLTVGGILAAVALALAAAGFTAESGGGSAGVAQAAVELFGLVVRLGANTVSFTRLAAFGLTHAALGLVVWNGARALWLRGGFSVAGVASMTGAVCVFAVGTALAFSLEALVAAVQALRLEYYELFSRVFVNRGRPFRPWHVPTAADAAGLVDTGGTGDAGGPAASGGSA
jgi:V/A-type H+-transporting ATPase subunit I